MSARGCLMTFSAGGEAGLLQRRPDRGMTGLYVAGADAHRRRQFPARHRTQRRHHGFCHTSAWVCTWSECGGETRIVKIGNLFIKSWGESPRMACSLVEIGERDEAIRKRLKNLRISFHVLPPTRYKGGSSLTARAPGPLWRPVIPGNSGAAVRNRLLPGGLFLSIKVASPVDRGVRSPR